MCELKERYAGGGGGKKKKKYVKLKQPKSKKKFENHTNVQSNY